MTDQPESADPWTDWITIWHSELAALAVDREVHEAAQRAIDLWAAQAETVVHLMRRATDAPARNAGTAAPARSTPPAHAPDARDALIEQLFARVAELERRLGPPAGC